jgi:DNA-binding transcriptional LysR family regulator
LSSSTGNDFLAFRVGPLNDSTLVARKMLRYRHQLLASQEHLDRYKAPKKPNDLLQHRLLAFSFWSPQTSWTFTKGDASETVTFNSRLAMNDYAGLATALVAGSGIGELPPIVAPHLLRNGKLVEGLPR